MRHALVAIALAGLACGKQTFLAAAFVQTPALPNPTSNDPDAGFPQYQVMTAYFGTIDTTDPTKIDANKLAPISNASASISFHHHAQLADGGVEDEDRYICATGSPGCASPTTGWTVSSPNPPTGSGATYVMTSASEKRLTFEINTPYTLALITCTKSSDGKTCDADGYQDGEAYGARLTPGPQADIKEFTVPTAVCTFTAPPIFTKTTPRCLQASLGKVHTVLPSITRTDPPLNGQYLPAFVLVARIDPNNPSAEPQITFKSVPADATALLKYVLSDIPYRWSTPFTLDESAFPQAGVYLVSILTVNSGRVSSNAFLGSIALAASGAAGLVIVQ